MNESVTQSTHLFLLQEGFKRVDHDYVLKCAELAKSGGLKHMMFMSTYGANHKSGNLYTGTKVLYFDTFST